MDRKYPNWLQEHFIFYDNATPHKSKVVMEFIQDKPISNTGVFSANSNPIETSFALVKGIFNQRFSQLLQ